MKASKFNTVKESLDNYLCNVCTESSPGELLEQEVAFLSGAVAVADLVGLTNTDSPIFKELVGLLNREKLQLRAKLIDEIES